MHKFMLRCTENSQRLNDNYNKYGVYDEVTS